MNDYERDTLAVNELKMLAVDMISKAGSGSPGACLSMAGVMYTLFTKVLNFYPDKPNYYNRDRVILSNLNLTPLYYAMLHMAGFGITREDLMKYRRFESITPGIPELHTTEGVDASLGFAGDGAGITAGLALGERYIANLLKAEDDRIDLLNFDTYCFLSDADVINGTSYEAFSFIAAQKLNRVMFLYDANNMSQEGDLNNVFVNNLQKKFSSYGFYVDILKNADDIKDIERAFASAKKSNMPAILIFKSVIGKGSFNEGKNVVSQGPLAIDDANSLRRKLNIFLPQFDVSKDSVLFIAEQLANRRKRRDLKLQEDYNRLKSLNSDTANYLMNFLETGQNPISFDSVNYKINDGYREALTESNYKVMNIIASKSNLFIGGSLGDSQASKVVIGGGEFQDSVNLKAKNIRFGQRGHVMPSILNGLALLNLKVFGSTKLTFSTESISGIRMSALMHLPVTYIFTHDSLYNSEEGPAHIPVEQLTMLRSIPELTIYRPADINEVMGTWESILKEGKPAVNIITTNSIPKLPGSDAKQVAKGGYILKKEKEKIDGIIITSGSETVSSLQIAYDLQKKGMDLRVVSMPSLELFKTQGKEYIESIIPKDNKVIVIEASNDKSWLEYTNNSNIINVKDFAPNGLPIEVLQNMSFDYDSIKAKVEQILNTQS